MLLPCSSPIITPESEQRHSSSDFHALRLDLLQNLTTLNVWIAARSTVLLLDENADNIDQNPYDIMRLGIESIKEALASLKRIKNITLSLPLVSDPDTEDGYVVASASDIEYGYIVAIAQLRTWRRGSGNRFHPALLPVFEEDDFSSNVYSSEERYIRALFAYWD